MKKILTLLIFLFLSSAMLFGQCPATANGNGNGRTFNLNYATANAASTALGMIASITFPNQSNGTVTILASGLELANSGMRIRPILGSAGVFGGQSPFTGSITINLTAAAGGGSITCTFIANALPVDLISFKGIKNDRQINLIWKTASEVNNEGFEIQKSNDGVVWNVFKFVEGRGNSSVLNTYTSTDRVPTQGSNYYRLKQMDFDGRFEYSKTVVVDFNSRLQELSLFPNPAKSQLTLVNGEGKATIFNTLGQPIKRLSVNDSQTDIQLTDLLSGQYYLQVVREDGTIVNKSFLKVD